MTGLQCHRLFFAIRPPVEIIGEIAALRYRPGVGGTPVSDAHLHVTLFMLGSFQDFPARQVTKICNVVSGAEFSALRVCFDLLVQGARSELLLASEPLRGAQALFEKLLLVLACAGIGPASWWPFQPHVTLRHTRQGGDIHPIDMLSWDNDQLFLIHSLVGLTRHRVCHQWSLSRGD
jgi:RNA 2',3'-cyclic 3'-phosphodiesterase